MKKLLSILNIMCILYGCSGKQENKILESKETIAQIDENSIQKIIVNLPNAEKYEKKGYIIDPKIAIYDSSLKPIDSLVITEDVAIVDILQKTKDMITASGDTLNAPCPTANFLKINYKDNTYIAYGTAIYEEIKGEAFHFKNDINPLSLYALKNFSIGFFGFGELTSCDDYHPLMVYEKEKFHKIYTTPKEDYYSKQNKLDYYYLNADDGVREKIKYVHISNDTIIANIYVEYQDGHSTYNLKISKYNGIFKGVRTNETKPEFD